MQSQFIEISGSVDFQGEDHALIFREDPKATIEVFDPENPDTPV